MAKGDVQEAARKRKPRRAVDVAARVAKHVDVPPSAEGVTPLNPGFFQLQRMRSRSVASKRRKMRGK